MTEKEREAAATVAFSVEEFDGLIEDVSRILETCGKEPTAVTKADLEVLRVRLLKKEVYEEPYHSLRAA